MKQNLILQKKINCVIRLIKKETKNVSQNLRVIVNLNASERLLTIIFQNSIFVFACAHFFPLKIAAAHISVSFFQNSRFFFDTAKKKSDGNFEFKISYQRVGTCHSIQPTHFGHKPIQLYSLFDIFFFGSFFEKFAA